MANRGPVDLLGKVPTKIRLRLDGEKLLARASTGAASAIRKRWGAGMGAEGAMPQADYEGAQAPMHRTGFMQRQIKGYWGTGKNVRRNKDGTRVRWVGPKGTYPDGKRAAMVYFVNVHIRPELKYSMPLGWDANVAQKASAFAQKDIAKQLKTKNAGLAMELRKLR